jgi:hypothetical protein
MKNEEEWMDADMMAENMAGKPTPRTAEEGVKIMETRLRILREREDKIRIAEHFADEAMRENCLIEVGREIRDAQSQLKHYQTQMEGRN